MTVRINSQALLVGLGAILLSVQYVSSFTTPTAVVHHRRQSQSQSQLANNNKHMLSAVPKYEDEPVSTSSRREWMKTIAASSLAVATTATTTTRPSFADDAAAALDMKTFVDPQGLFALRVPSTFYTLRRTVKGDLPDAKTGKGRRGSSIFTAGNMAKAEVIAVERFPIRVLLEENGIEATGDLTSFPAIGKPEAVANLLVIRREKDTQSKGPRVLDNVKVSADGKEISFRLKTEIEVQKPELLMEQYGISQLFRITLAKCTLSSDDGNVMAVFASALEQDFENGVDGPALQDSVDSFIATKQEGAPSQS